MPKRLVRATFSNGRVLERGSLNKVYTHAYVVSGTRPEGKTWGFSGFSTSEDQCWRNLRSESAWCRKQPGAVVTIEEVVAVVNVTKRQTLTPIQQLAADEASERILHQQVGEE